MSARNRYAPLLAIALMSIAVAAHAANDGAIQITSDSIGGVVTGPKGPEAGVWVIAETRDLPSHYIKIVVTDDQGRYLLPGLPKAKYEVWVRGYGLVDSQHVQAAPGAMKNLTAVAAANAREAADYYPSAYWLSMLEPPALSEFPGTGDKGNGISPNIRTQQYWMEQVKEQCMSCHQLGDQATRMLGGDGNSVQAWSQRIHLPPRPKGDTDIGDAGKALMMEMQYNMSYLGPLRSLKMYADWTDKIAGGATPKQTPPRPSGIERNIVVTIADWGAGHYIHDQISSDHRDPTVNAGGPAYGTSMYHGLLEYIDPKTLQTKSIPIPGLDGSAHDPRAGIHANEMDDKGRVWNATGSARNTPEPQYCSDGSVPSSKYYPLTDRKLSGQLPVYDPATGKVTNIPICIGGNHNAFDPNGTLYMSGSTEVISWIDTRVWDATHDPKLATGWCPVVLDTSGDGKIDPDRTHWAHDQVYEQTDKENIELDPDIVARDETARRYDEPSLVVPKGKDLQIKRFLYGLGASQVDGSVWEAAYDAGIPKMRSGIVRFVRGDHPPETCKAEFYEPPLKDGKYAAYGIRAVGVDAEGVAWAEFSSGKIGSFDRRKCKVLNGPTATGQHCPEGWSFYELPTPMIGKTDANSDFPYNIWFDWQNVMGLGKGTRFFPTANSDSIVALPPDASKFVTFRVPYPMGFYNRGADFRIDNANAGWSGKKMNSTYSSKAQWHQENADEPSKWVSFQVRPNPLAH